MKTNTNKSNKTQNTQKEGLRSRPEQLGTEKKTDNRPRIDLALRRTNRMLNTETLLGLLRNEAPRLFELAEVVGKWVWITFTEKQPSDITGDLAEFGFHWNNRRQSWQHPCGTIPERADYDPRERYGSFFAADQKAA